MMYKVYCLSRDKGRLTISSDEPFPSLRTALSWAYQWRSKYVGTTYIVRAGSRKDKKFQNKILENKAHT